MIYYSPINKDVLTAHITYRPRTCFIITQLNDECDKELEKMLQKIEELLKSKSLKSLDATSRVTGSDFLDKIWKICLSTPIGIAVVTNSMPLKTISNIFYEIGLADSLGKETIIIKSNDFDIPSDFIRTEYINYDSNFSNKFTDFINSTFELAEYYGTMAEQLEAKPLLSLDYLRRAYLITGDKEYQESAKKIMEKNSFDEHTKIILSGFINN